MSSVLLDPPAVSALEGRMDDEYTQTSVGERTYSETAWMFLSVAEDYHRTLMDVQQWLEADPTVAERPAHHINIRMATALDDYKYAARQGLSLLKSKLSDDDQAKPQFVFRNDGERTRALGLLLRSGEYANLARSFASFHNGLVNVFKHEDGSIEFSQLPELRPYSVLEHLCWDQWQPTGSDGHSSIDLLIELINMHGPLEEIALKIGRKTAIRGGRAKYQFVTKLAHELATFLKKDQHLLPTEWRFPWGVSATALAVFNGLYIRAAYHVAALEVLRRKSRLAHDGLHQICLVIETDDLLNDLSRLTQLTSNEIRPVVSALTYGRFTTSPDPALQPIIPLHGSTVAIPPCFLNSLHSERNFLSLHARTDQSSFDRSSSIFEKQMTERLARTMRARFTQLHCNIKVPDGKKGEEVDILAVDLTSRTILLLELRWMLGPGDAREVINRIAACKAKASQLERKVTAARAFLSELLRKLGLTQTDGWTVNGVVVIEGFGGTAASQQHASVPIVPQPVLVAVMRNMPGVGHLYRVLASGAWLPREGRDFSMSFKTETIFGVKRRRPSFQLGGEKYFDTVLPRVARSFAAA